MLKKTLSGVLAVAIGAAFLWVDLKEVFVIGVAIVSAMAVYEILVATKYISNTPSAIICIAFAAAVPFVLSYDFRHTPYFVFTLIIGLFLVMILSHRKVKFAQLSLITFVSLCIPFALTSIVLIYDSVPAPHRTFLVLYTCVVTWVSDSGAYFAGTLFGKHKMAPGISPKKTWEGFAGGLLISSAFGAGLSFGYQWLFNSFLIADGGSTISVNVLALALLALPCAMLGVVGDLSASVLKRECSVKDFGNVLPAHGGFVDRFDSVLFAAPFAYLVFSEYVPISSVAGGQL